MTSGTARTSEDSKSSSRFESSGTPSTSLSPIEQVSPFSEIGPHESPAPKKLHKPPTMPSSPPPPPPATLTKLGTPPRIPAVTATQATPPNARRADRSPSPGHSASRAKLQPHRLQPRHVSPAPSPRGRSVSAQPPMIRGVSSDGLRAVSGPMHARSPSKNGSDGSPPATADKRKSRMSWFGGGGGRSRANSDVAMPRTPGAWVMSPESQIDYNTALLVNGEKVPELWNESGNVYVYLHPKESGRGPSFKVPDHLFSPSSILVELLVTEMMAATSHSNGYLDVAPAAPGPVSEGHLYLPLGNTDLDRLVAARNLFALLTHQPLVGTAQNPTYFTAVLQIAGLLRRFNFSSYDGASFGESVDVAFDFFMDCTGIADVRHSREKTLEALILAEQMKSWTLYSEAFPHAVGKYEMLLDLKSPLYDRISVSTRQRLDRAHLDLANRQANVNLRLEAFEFPSLFAGTASSTSTEEYKNVKFKEWRNSFAKMRSFVLGYYKGLFGNWPPRARSKKNYFSQSGLNRQCLKILYSDFCALYDLLVDRESMTPRVIGEGFEDSDSDSKDKLPTEASISALRKILGEFDKSSPPCCPPSPPTMTAIYENYNDLPAKKQAKFSKSLQPHELQLILLKSRNIDTDALPMPFLLAYKEYELAAAKSTNPADLPDLRIGAWLFLYVVLQSLPMLVVDAPGLRYTEGVEDFLCEAPQGNPPWTEDAGLTRKMWYKTGSDHVVELSADVVMFSVEGIYMRSHCWLAAKDPHGTAPSPPLSSTSPLLRPRSGSVNDRARQAFRASIAIGLEPLPLPLHPLPPAASGGAPGERTSRVLSVGSLAGGGIGHPLHAAAQGGGSPEYQVGGCGGGGDAAGGLRASRSAVNLGGYEGFMTGSGGGGGGFGVGGEQGRKGSQGGQGQVPASESGGSTFDDILKGMDEKGKKKKKTLFF
ncbi:hypothetical protein NEMBOFW57_003009 [Staphylotrichum longicolle]|uniref:DUF8004 domain-containing protein n=1 Tax=Staphylotrichum longicolle TaxID=669026 RepID=A0AAD4F4I8_9PEZI|nr:hypothetical protein NEMBOFW57_003009 [Staphylotrichum longicolle]